MESFRRKDLDATEERVRQVRVEFGRTIYVRHL